MIKHILKTIWTERKINAWILLELILVFCILWFCADYMLYIGKKYIEPRGFDITHTYKIGINLKEEGRKVANSGTDEEKKQMLDNIWTIYDRVKQYPAVESVSYSSSAAPYSGSWSSGDLTMDSVVVPHQRKTVSPGFFEVFDIKIIHGKAFTFDNIIAENPAMIGPGADDKFGPRKPENVDYAKYSEEHNYKIIGVANKVKKSEYENYDQILYFPLKKDNMNILDYREMCIRIKPEADKNFIEQFKKDMTRQLEVEHYFLSSIIPLEKDREMYMDWKGYSNNFKSIYSVSAFLIINIFLGIIGTFWFRIQSRRNEIGLRIALGATRKNIKQIFISETLLLLFLASVIATIFCINISISDILKDIGVPVIDKDESSVISQLANYIATFAFLAIITIIAVWYPAMKASKIQPAETLRAE